MLISIYISPFYETVVKVAQLVMRQQWFWPCWELHAPCITTLWHLMVQSCFWLVSCALSTGHKVWYLRTCLIIEFCCKHWLGTFPINQIHRYNDVTACSFFHGRTYLKPQIFEVIAMWPSEMFFSDHRYQLSASKTKQWRLNIVAVCSMVRNWQRNEPYRVQRIERRNCEVTTLIFPQHTGALQGYCGARSRTVAAGTFQHERRSCDACHDMSTIYVRQNFQVLLRSTAICLPLPHMGHNTTQKAPCRAMTKNPMNEWLWTEFLSFQPKYRK